ncbi:MAG: hypothetical protein NC935_08315 [Candidatus Omnitrophica bacterium]|nr:hypothetical protein [Candidatus Omnitrophota bacterium]
MPLSYKSGRYGIDMNQIKILRRLDYKVDISITPFINHSMDGGPNFSNMPYIPYFVSEQDAHNKTQKSILEIPLSVGFTRINFKNSAKIFNFIESISPKLLGVLAKFNILERIIFSPEKESLKKMKKLIDIYLKKKIPIIHLQFHSQNIIVDGTPYVKGEKNHKRFLQRLDGILDYAINEKHLKSVSCSEFYDIFKNLPKAF